MNYLHYKSLAILNVDSNIWIQFILKIKKWKIALLHSDSYLNIFYQFIYFFSKLIY